MALVILMPRAGAGQINFGDPQVSGDTVTVPVLLQADTSGDVSSLDFRVRYDPSQLRPVRANPGPSAQNADKDVIGNERGPGEFSVVMMGLNRNTVGDGEVANITFQRVGTGDAADLRITQTTLASPDALEIPSRGSSRTIDFGGGQAAPEQQQESPQQQQQQQQQEGDTAQQSPQQESATPGQTQTAQADTGSGLPDGTVGGPAAPQSPNGATPAQPGAQPGATGPTAGAGTQPGGEEGTPTGAAADTSQVQGQLQDAIASADAARSGVGTPAAGTAEAERDAGQDPASRTARGAQAGAPEGTDAAATGGATDGRMEMAQARSVGEAGQAAQREGGGTAPAAAPGTTVQTAPAMLPLLIAGGAAVLAIGLLFVVRKKLFA